MRAPGEVAVTPTRPARRQMPTWLLLMMIVIGLAMLIVLPFATWLFQQDLPTFTIIIDGTEHVLSISLAGLSWGQKGAVVALLLALVTAALIAVPVVLLFALFLGVGLPLLVVLVAALAMLSPILLLLLVLRRISRASARRAQVARGGFGPNISA